MTDERLCMVCTSVTLTASELQTCTSCLGSARLALIDIDNLSGMLATELLGRAGTAPPLDPSGVRGDTDRLPGGDILDLLVDGSAQSTASPTGNREHVQDHAVGGVSVASVLGSWEDDWRGRRHLAAATAAATVSAATSFLLQNVGWAAQHHPAFDDFAREIQDLRSRLRRVTGDGDSVEAAAIACPQCKGELTRHVADPDACDHDGPHCDHSHPSPTQWPCHGSNTCACDQGGRRDDWVCRRCARTVESAEYWLAVRQRWEEREAAR